MTPLKNILRLAALLALIACSSKKTESPPTDSTTSRGDTSGIVETNYEKFFDIKTYVVTGNIPAEEIQTIDSTSAIIINPTEEQIAALIKENGEEDFYTIADDASFYQANAISELDSFAVTTIVADKRYIKLVGDDQSWLVDIRLKGAPEWNIIFFDRRKEPKVISAIDVTPEELFSYFGPDR
jgi:hypothetical protein